MSQQKLENIKEAAMVDYGFDEDPGNLFTNNFVQRNACITPHYRAHDANRRILLNEFREEQMLQVKQLRTYKENNDRANNQAKLKKWENFREARKVVQKKYRQFNDRRRKIYWWCSTVKLILNLKKIAHDMKEKKRNYAQQALEKFSQILLVKKWKLKKYANATQLHNRMRH